MARSTDSAQAGRRWLFGLLGPDACPPEGPRPAGASEHLDMFSPVDGLERQSFIPATRLDPAPGCRQVGWVVYLHGHGHDLRLGRREVTEGRPYLRSGSYGPDLTRAGWSVVAPDMPLCGDRWGEPEEDAAKRLLLQGRCLWGWMVADALRVVRALLERVDGKPVVVMGMSMGGVLARWVAALEPAVAGCVEVGAVVDWHSLVEERQLPLHGWHAIIPGALNPRYEDEGRSVFRTTYELVAHRPHFAGVGLQDPLCPRADVDRAIEWAGPFRGLDVRPYACGHIEPEAMRDEVLAFLRVWS